jgi:RNA methyltransferase, TrmH family
MLSKNQIKSVQNLHLKKFRDAERRFIGEGVKTVLEITAQRPELVESVFAVEEFIARHGQELKGKGIAVTEVGETELKKLSMQVTPNQVLAVCRYFPEEKIGAPKTTSTSFYLDDIRDPGNLGTILRIADWFGLRTVFCSPNSCDLYNPKVLQASMGAFLRVKVQYVLLSELCAGAAFENIYGAVLGGKDLYHEKLGKGLIVIGNEANGIHPNNLPRITSPITIPASGDSQTESLNAAMAAAIIASELFRQNRS